MPFSSLMAPQGISRRERFCSCMGKRPPRTTSPPTRRDASLEAAAAALAEDADSEDAGGGRRRKRRRRQGATAAAADDDGGGIAGVMMAVPTWGWNGRSCLMNDTACFVLFICFWDPLRALPVPLQPL